VFKEEAADAATIKTTLSQAAGLTNVTTSADYEGGCDLRRRPRRERGGAFREVGRRGGVRGGGGAGPGSVGL
jgi:hypothetical protein